jgi:hypothetical protein
MTKRLQDHWRYELQIGHQLLPYLYYESDIRIIVYCHNPSFTITISILTNQRVLSIQHTREKSFFCLSIHNILLNVVTIDWEEKLEKVLTPEEREIATKMLRLNGGPAMERLLAAFLRLRINQHSSNAIRFGPKVPLPYQRKERKQKKLRDLISSEMSHFDSSLS